MRTHARWGTVPGLWGASSERHLPCPIWQVGSGFWAASWEGRDCKPDCRSLKSSASESQEAAEPGITVSGTDCGR